MATKDPEAEALARACAQQFLLGMAKIQEVADTTDIEADITRLMFEVLGKPLLALVASVKLQSHYAELLNQHDGGQRIVFPSAQAWLDRLAAVRT